VKQPDTPGVDVQRVVVLVEVLVRRDLGNVTEAYVEVARRLGILKQAVAAGGESMH
jgi:hypothetical protein